MINKKCLATILLLISILFPFALASAKAINAPLPAQEINTVNSDLPVIIMPAPENDKMPLVLVITGDGGWKGLDQTLSANFVKEGAPVVALNALKYFWNKKSPEETTRAVARLLTKYMQQWHKSSFILVGFSFGADVMPFIANRLPTELTEKNKLISLLSPSKSTDFEIHISQMLSAHHQYADKVLPEINKIKNVSLLCFFGDEETDFPVNELPKKNCDVIILKGGHHYEENKSDLAKTILAHAK